MMLMKQLRLKCDYRFTLVALVALGLLAPAGVNAQTGRVTVKASVSEITALSVFPNFTGGDIDADVIRSGNTVRIILSGADSTIPLLRVPLLVRSNSSFQISAVVESTTAALTQLSITDVRATGTLVSPQAISELNVPLEFDGRAPSESAPTKPSSFELSRPFSVASGPRVSLGGTLDSPHNALQITILLRVKPQPARSWSVDLTFIASAGFPVQ
jgi:hypothetical protein